MPVYELNGVRPQLPASGDYYIAPGAQVIGNVRIGEGASIWFNAVVRGDNELIDIGAGANVQDNSVLHSDPGFPLTIGRDVTIGHSAIVHGCSVGDGALIGMGATVLNGAKIGARSIVGANALVTEGKAFPDGAMIVGAPAKMVRIMDERQQKAGAMTAAGYAARAGVFRSGLREA